MTPEELTAIKERYAEAKKHYNAYIATYKTNLMNTELLKAEFVRGKRCERCGSDKNITYDHIIPVQILTSFGFDDKREYWEENGQPLCYACNQLKANRLDMSNKKTRELLLKLLT